MSKKSNNNHFNNVDFKESKTFKEWHKDFHCCNTKSKYLDAKTITLLIGAPNVGKSTFFNKITTSTASVSNIDRMTVDDAMGRIKKHKDHVVIDLPGLYNLSHPIDEELVVAHEICHEKFDRIANVIGAQSIKRDLYLSIQAIETGVLSTLVLNMIDEVNSKIIDLQTMSKMLNNVTIIPTQANRNKNTDLAVQSILKDKVVGENLITYSPTIEKWIDKLVKILPKRKVSSRFYALMLLEGNVYVKSFYQSHFPKTFKEINDILEQTKDFDFSTEIKKTRIAFIDKLIDQCFKNKTTENKQPLQYLKSNKTKQHKFDSFILNKAFGIPLVILLLVVIYYISFGPYMGGSLKDLFDEFLNGVVSEKGLKPLFLDVFHASEWTTDLFVSGIFGGFFAVLTFLPTIIILFTLVNLIQQIGVISRLSALLDRTFEHFGLSGRSVVNLITGFGCNVPSVMMARSSNSKKEKIVSIIISPFISCSARAIVYSFICNLIMGATFGWMGMIGLMLFSAIIALTIGLIFSKTMFRKQKSFFMIEMVDWRKPDFVVIFKNVWLEIKSFVKKIIIIILIANFLIWLFLHLSINGAIMDDKIDESLLAYAGKGINYLMFPFGGNSIHGWVNNPNGWKMTVSLISSIPAKETAISNLEILFGDEHVLNSFMINELPITLSYLVVFMLYIPCLTTIQIVKKEGGWKILGINLSIMISISYIFGILTYWITYACM